MDIHDCSVSGQTGHLHGFVEMAQHFCFNHRAAALQAAEEQRASINGAYHATLARVFSPAQLSDLTCMELIAHSLMSRILQSHFELHMACGFAGSLKKANPRTNAGIQKLPLES